MPRGNHKVTWASKVGLSLDSGYSPTNDGGVNARDLDELATPKRSPVVDPGRTSNSKA